MNSQEVSNTLNALSKLPAAAALTSQTSWAALARAVENTAPEMSPQGVANELNALSKLERAAEAMSASGWGHLARQGVSDRPVGVRPTRGWRLLARAPPRHTSHPASFTCLFFFFFNLPRVFLFCFCYLPRPLN